MVQYTIAQYSTVCQYLMQYSAVQGASKWLPLFRFCFSHSEGPCCDNTTCAFKANGSMACSPSSDCAKEAYCNGREATCPVPPAKPDVTTLCQHNMKVCLNGVGSLCVLEDFLVHQVSYFSELPYENQLSLVRENDHSFQPQTLTTLS